MRIKIKFTPNTQPVTRNMENVTRWLHTVLGKDNPFHDGETVYTMSSLLGGTFIDKQHEDFKNGGYVVVSSCNQEFITTFIKNAPFHSFGFGMNYDGLSFISDFNNVGNRVFYAKTVKSGLLLKDYGSENNYLTYKDDEFLNLLNTKTRKKLLAIDPTIDLSNFNIEIAENTKGNRVINMVLKKHKYPTSDITLKIFGNKKIFELLYYYGLGSSTGCGFGMLYPTQNWREYLKY